MNRVYGRTIRTLHRFPKPVVALVEGIAVGAGANLALACDLVYAGESARFCEIFAKRGIALDCGGSWLLPRAMSVSMNEALEIEALAQATCTATDDFSEGMRAFLEKRAPEFKGP